MKYEVMKIIIRKAEMKDMLSIQKLMDALNVFRAKNHSEKNDLFHKRIKSYEKLKQEDIEKDSIFVVALEEKIVAYIWGSIDYRKSHVLSKMMSLDEFFVDEQFRGEGLGKQLLETLEKEAVKLGCDHMITHTDYNNKNAQKVYSSFDMKAVTVEFWKEL